MATTAPPFNGYNETSTGSAVYKAKVNPNLVSKLTESKIPEFTIISDANKGKYQFLIELPLGGGTIVYAEGGPDGFKINPNNSETVRVDIENTPGLKEYLNRLNKTVKEQTKSYVENNGNLSGTEKNKILNTDFYRPVKSSGTNDNETVLPAQKFKDIEIKATNESQNFGIMKYPLDAPKNLDFIKFDIFEPIKSTFGGQKTADGKTLGNVGQFLEKQYVPGKIGVIFLPIQPNINDTNEVGWGEDRLSLIEMTAANLSLGYTGGTASTVDEILGGIGDQLGKNKDAVDSVIKAFTAGTLSRSGGNIFTRVTGAMLNPNLELIFNGPKLRQFTYTIKLTPRSPKEGNMVRKIIRAFKQNMAPRVAASNYFLQTPHVFGIDYLFNGETPHKGLNKIKASALMSCSVNYTPANNYMPYVDGTMTSYELTLQFQELLPIYDVDYLVDNDIKLSDDVIKLNNIESMSIGY